VQRTRIEPAVCLGSSQRSWVTALINYVSDHGGMRVVGTVLTQDDAVAMEFDVLVIDDVSSVLSPRLVDRVQSLGRVVVGVYGAERGAASRDRLLAAGVDAAVASDARPADFVRTVVDAVRQRSVDSEFADLVDGMAETDGAGAVPATPPRPAAPARAHGGRIVVVAGSDGVTEVTVGLAHAMASRGTSTVVVDMDTLEPSVAQRLGLALTPNIFTATEHLRLRSSIADAYVTHPEGFAVIAGIPNPREWENLSEIEAADLVEELAGSFGAVVVKINRHLEDLSTFAGSPGRFDVGRRMTVMAGSVVAVTGASPLGSTRLLALASDLRYLTAAPTHVVVNQAPSSQFIRGEIGEELHRTLTPASLEFVGSEARVRKAAWQGEVVRGGRFAKRMASLAGAITARDDLPVTAQTDDAVGPAPSPVEGSP
jgi:hypothetical protein